MSSNWSLIQVAASLALAATWFLVPASSFAQDSGTIGIRLLEAPVGEGDNPRAQIYIVDHVDPGAQLERRFEVVNNTADPVRLELYPGAAEVSNGAFRPDDDSSENELTSWIRINPASLELEPGARAQATAQISVPADAGSGERYAAIWAQPPPSGGPHNVVNRVGIRVYLSVGHGAEPPSDFSISSLVARRTPDGTPLVTADVTNTGERALDMSGSLQLMDGPGGLSAGPFRTEGVTTLAPGQTEPMSVRLDDGIPSGPWLARLVARSGELEKAVEATIVFPDAAGESSDPVDASEVPLHRDRGFLIPLALGLLLLALLLLFLFWWWRRRKDDEDDESKNGVQKVREKISGRK